MAYAKIRPRRGTKTEWNLIDPVLLEGEIAIEVPDSGVGTGLCKVKIGDGNKRWSELEYALDGSAAESINGGTVTDYKEIRLRSGTTSEWTTLNPVLALGEPVFDETKGAIKIGDGIHNFNSLPYIGYTQTDISIDYDFGDIDEEL